MTSVIKVENLSKRYRLGKREVKKDTLFGQIGYIMGAPVRNFKTLMSLTNLESEKDSVFWALNDINFEVEQGDVLGIIGHNGAGKSTLLKILSRITEPSSGKITIQGRIAALLEVGTGFHKELTGRENIYMNGTILGMTRREIDSKLDEIIDFSGVEQHIDTPVKFYSSGMNVRLGFSVAAHLEPEILVIDEVLAVGDAEFQKKCLGKMQDVSGHGRTVLFVSHNMEALQNLCTSAIILKHGHLVAQGQTHDMVHEYLKNYLSSNNRISWEFEKAPGNEDYKFLEATVTNGKQDNSKVFYTSDEIHFKLTAWIKKPGQQIDLTYHLVDEMGTLVYVGSSAFIEHEKLGGGFVEMHSVFPRNVLNEGTYSVSRLLLVLNKGHALIDVKDSISFDLLPAPNGLLGWMGNKEGVLKLSNVSWEINQTQNDTRN
jgi:lipopolysaccharide transport system ATP-binding protein